MDNIDYPELYDRLLFQAEELMTEHSIGQYLVGAYISGEKLFVDNGEIELLCLYVNPTSELLNPITRSNKPTDKRKYVFNVDLFCTKIIFVDLLDWADWLIDYKDSITSAPSLFLYIAPFFGEVLYEEESISSILDAAKNYLEKLHFIDVPFNRKIFDELHTSPKNRVKNFNYSSSVNDALRTWLCECELNLKDAYDAPMFVSKGQKYPKLFSSTQELTEAQNLQQQFGKAIENFYRFML